MPSDLVAFVALYSSKVHLRRKNRSRDYRGNDGKDFSNSEVSHASSGNFNGNSARGTSMLV